ncbi:putative RNA-binding protein 40 [Apostichopus japonicus]|uniref:RNA-binding region-containing protein 3 n=1 Tax=Stichopus japonicus TaxID=307972 RepID=A0A2G8JJH3_STIJA|nr:putative RNA-binding protein 40 [Apostichopus japonicus]
MDVSPQKYCAFAYFPDHFSASNALQKLHQMTIHGRTLTVEYARRNEVTSRKDNDTIARVDKTKSLENQKETRDLSSKKMQEEKAFLEGPINLSLLSDKLGLKYPLNPSLKYSYPRPTQQIIINIANTLAAVPPFYNQVLHLMNKMNLPAPFSLSSFPAPPLPQEDEPRPPEPDEMEISSEEESELESDEDGVEKRSKDVFPMKRPSKRRVKKPKRSRIEQLLATAKPAFKPEATSQVINPSEVFEEPAVPLKRPEIKLSEGIAAALSKHTDSENEPPQPSESAAGPGIAGGFGTFTPALPTVKKDDEGSEEEEENESTDYITREQLKNRLSKEEMKNMSVFKRYNPGEPNTRLYIKNLSKQVEEKDLKYVYGRYVDWTSALDKDMFSIQLMKQGRMKGQAFVGLPSDYSAKKAVKETNGYLLHGKPLVVVFARSAKPKPVQEETKVKKS